MCAEKLKPLGLRQKPKAGLDNLERIKEPMVIGSLCIGEHVPDEVAKDICAWTTGCLQKGISPRQFKLDWNKFREGEDEEFKGVPGKTGDEYWSDVTVWEDGELDELYAKAVKSRGDHFVWHDNNAYISIVALRGNPGAQAIEVCVLGEENCKDETGKWLSTWPAEAGPGATIAYIRNGVAVLQDGTEITAG